MTETEKAIQDARDTLEGGASARVDPRTFEANVDALIEAVRADERAKMGNVSASELVFHEELDASWNLAVRDKRMCCANTLTALRTRAQLR